MKAQAFLELVGEMRAAQSKYFKERTQSNLIAAKDLEKRVDVVVKAGKLEPDATATVNVYTAGEYQAQMALIGSQRLNDVEGEPVDETTNK